MTLLLCISTHQATLVTRNGILMGFNATTLPLAILSKRDQLVRDIYSSVIGSAKGMCVDSLSRIFPGIQPVTGFS